MTLKSICQGMKNIDIFCSSCIFIIDNVEEVTTLVPLNSVPLISAIPLISTQFVCNQFSLSIPTKFCLPTEYQIIFPACYLPLPEHWRLHL